MLNKKFNHKRLKPKPKKEPDYLRWLHEVKQPTCFVCNIAVGIQMHHIKRYSSDYRDDTKIIPLCYNHHLGNELSPHGTPNRFRELFPIEQQLEYAERLWDEYNER